MHISQRYNNVIKRYYFHSKCMHIAQRYYNVIITLLESITIIYPFHNVMITLCVCWVGMKPGYETSCYEITQTNLFGIFPITDLTKIQSQL